MRLQKFVSRLLLDALAASMVLGSITHAGAASTAFPDVSRSAWYYNAVTALAGSGVVSGYEDGTFRPNGPATTGEAAKLVLSAGGYSAPERTTTHWASGYLNFAAERSFLSEPAQNPDIPITRGEVAELMIKALGLARSGGSSPFADTSDPYVTALYQAGITAGSYENGKLVYRPDATITRGELCAMLYRLDGKEKLQYGSYTLDIHENLLRNTYRSDLFEKRSGLMQYAGCETTVGMDVSYYQGNIDWAKVKAAGIDFAILRLGYRGYEAGTLALDSKFYEYLAGADAAGVDVGIYFFSQAVTVAEAREEAEFVLKHLGGRDIKYPVVFDWEIIGVKPARTDGLSTQTLTACAEAFCDTIADAGYTPAIYFTKYLGYVSYDLSRLAAYDFWFAEYTAAPSFYYDFDMWQYTDTANIPGISGNVDLDICFKKY